MRFRARVADPAGARARWTVLACSAEIYGLSFRDGVPLDEAAPLRPANPFAASKAACDLAVGEMALRGLGAVRLRSTDVERVVGNPARAASELGWAPVVP